MFGVGTEAAGKANGGMAIKLMIRNTMHENERSKAPTNISRRRCNKQDKYTRKERRAGACNKARQIYKNHGEP